jgi:Rrf2 family protein
MRISQKAEHALTAVLDLALHAPLDSGVRSSEVARRTGVPEKFLEAILRDLRRAGLVSSKRGPDGGHWLARDPSRVTVGAVLEAIDGPLATASAGTPRAGSPEAASLRSLWGRVEEAVSEILGNVTLDDLRRETRAYDALDFTI